MLNVTFLTSQIWRWLLDFWKVCGPSAVSTKMEGPPVLVDHNEFQCSNSRILYWDVMPCSLLDTYISEQPAVSIFRVQVVNEPMCKMSHSRRLISGLHCCENLNCRIQCCTKKGSNICLLSIVTLHYTSGSKFCYKHRSSIATSNLNTYVHSQLSTPAEARCKTTHTK